MRKLYETRTGRVLTASAAVLAGLGASMVTSGCSRPLPSDKIVHQCFTGDIPSRTDMRLGIRDPITLNEGPHALLTGDYTPTKADLARIANATVLISYIQKDRTPYFGTGTLTKDKQGRTIVIGPAHVAGGVALSSLRITDHQNRQLPALSGCYTYGNSTQGNMALPPKQEGQRSDPAKVPNVDVAAIVVGEPGSLPTGDDTIPIGTGQPKRGKWYTTTNFAGTSSATSTYNVLDLTDSRDIGAAQVLSGIEPTNPAYTKSGSSGGGLVDVSGNAALDGIIVQTTPLDLDSLQGLYVTLKYGPNTPQPPHATLDTVVTADYLGLAQGVASNTGPIGWPRQ